jgi:hypothetical protein
MNCTDCPKGTFNSETGQSECSNCTVSTTQFQGSLSESDCSICTEGYFGSPPTIHCLSCPTFEGMDCDNAGFIPNVHAGYFRTSNTTVVACAPSEACLRTGDCYKQNAKLDTLASYAHRAKMNIIPALEDVLHVQLDG